MSEKSNKPKLPTISNSQIAIAILGFIAVIVYAPLMSLWVFNTIFKLNLEYNFWTWLAMSWVHLIIFISRSTNTTTTINTSTPSSFYQDIIRSNKNSNE